MEITQYKQKRKIIHKKKKNGNCIIQRKLCNTNGQD